MSSQAAALLNLLTNSNPHRWVYRAHSGSGWFVTYNGGQVNISTVRELYDEGHIVSVYSNCPHDAYHVGRTLDVDRSMAARRKHGKSASLIYIGDPPSEDKP